MKAIFYALWQCTWGILQTFMGLIFFFIHIANRHYIYHGAVITEWENNSSVSLGLFVFLSRKTPADKNCPGDTYDKTLVHEYGHTIQSLLLGPLYLVVIGIPSSIWAMLPCFSRLRKERGISYFALYTESWANLWGEKVTGEMNCYHVNRVDRHPKI